MRKEEKKSMEHAGNAPDLNQHHLLNTCAVCCIGTHGYQWYGVKKINVD